MPPQQPGAYPPQNAQPGYYPPQQGGVPPQQPGYGPPAPGQYGPQPGKPGFPQEQASRRIEPDQLPSVVSGRGCDGGQHSRVF